MFSPIGENVPVEIESSLKLERDKINKGKYLMIMKVGITLIIVLVCIFFLRTPQSKAEDLKAGDNAPLFTLRTHDGKDFSLASRRGAGWTILYFYPKAETPGCTKQACAFRDSINEIHKLGAEVYGISSDSVESQKEFHENHQLTFTLLADDNLEVIRLYGAKMPILSMSKRWTFIIDPDLVIRSANRDVDPVSDPVKVAEELRRLQ